MGTCLAILMPAHAMEQPMSTTSAPNISVRPERSVFHLSSSQRREIKKFLEALLYLSPALIIFSIFVFIPLVRSIRLSMFLTNPIGVPTVFAGLTNYQRLFESPAFLNSMQRSFLFVLYTVPATLVLSMGLASLGNLRLRRIDVFRMIFACTIAVSGGDGLADLPLPVHPSIGSLNYLLILFGISRRCPG